MKASLRYFSGVVAGGMLAAAALAAGGAGSVQPAAGAQGSMDPSSFGGIQVNTKPSRDSTLGFTFPVEIGEIVVKGGQRVHKGDLLVQGRDDDVRYQRDLQKSMADSDLDVEKSQVALDEAEAEFKAQEQLRDLKKGGQELEYQRAKSLRDQKKVELEISKLQYRQQSIQLQVRQAMLDRYALRAPFDGIIDMVSTDVGEVKRETDPVLKIVATDPLWMDVSAPTDQTITLGLKPGDKAWVVLDVPGQREVYAGRVIEVGATSDYAANVRRVRVELDNPNDYPAGLAAWVRFTPPEGEWAKLVTRQGKRAAESGPAAGGQRAGVGAAVSAGRSEPTTETAKR